MTTTETIAPWQFLMQIAELQPPAGCTFTTPGVNGTNLNLNSPIPVQLTDRNGKSDTIILAPSTILTVTVDQSKEEITTSTVVSEKELTTVGKGGESGLSYARVGNVICE